MNFRFFAASPLAACIAANAIFGLSPFALNRCLYHTDNDIFLILGLRFTIAFLVFSLLIALRVIHVSYGTHTIKPLICIGLFNPTLSFLSEILAMKFMPSAQFGVIVSLTPIMMAVLSVFLLHEIPSKRQIAFMLLSIAGVLLINYAGGSLPALGFFVTILHVITMSLSKIQIRRYRTCMSAASITYATFFIGAVCFTGISLVQHTIKGTLSSIALSLASPGFILPLLLLALGSSVLGMTLINYATTRLPIAVNAALSCVCTLITILCGVFFLNEPFSIADIAGSVVIIASVLGVACLCSAPENAPRH